MFVGLDRFVALGSNEIWAIEGLQMSIGARVGVIVGTGLDEIGVLEVIVGTLLEGSSVMERTAVVIRQRQR